MAGELLNCWEIKGCGRNRDGDRVLEAGECPASRLRMGHTCWLVAGTFCKGKIEGELASRLLYSCILCDVYGLYNRTSGTKKDELILLYPDEQQKYESMPFRQANFLECRNLEKTENGTGSKD